MKDYLVRGMTMDGFVKVVAIRSTELVRRGAEIQGTTPNATAAFGRALTAASMMVFYSLDYSMSNFEQAKARIHRVSQEENCLYIYLIAKNTVDRKVLRSLRNKVDLAKLLVDDYRKGRNPFKD